MPGRARPRLDFRYHRATIHRSMRRRPELCSRALTSVTRPARKRQPGTTGESRSCGLGSSAYSLRRVRMATSGWSSWLKGFCGWSPNRGALIDRVGVNPYIDPRQSKTVVGVASRNQWHPQGLAHSWVFLFCSTRRRGHRPRTFHCRQVRHHRTPTTNTLRE